MLIVSRDANNKIIILAFAVVRAENARYWTWFLATFRAHALYSNNPTVISDRHPGIISAVEEILGQHAHHVHCTWHIRCNMIKKAGVKFGKKAAKLFDLASKALNKFDFDRHYSELRTESKSVVEYLENGG